MQNHHAVSMMTVFVVALGAALVGGDAQAQPSFPGCQNLPGGVSYSSWLSTRPVSEFNTQDHPYATTPDTTVGRHNGR